MKNEKREKIKNFIKEYENIEDIFSEYPSNLDVESLFYSLSIEELIDFCVYSRETLSDSWLQAEYYNTQLGKNIIIDYDFNQCFKDINEVIDTIEWTEKEIERINKKVKN